MTRRRLTDDEVALWKKVAESAEKMHPAAPRAELPKPKPKPVKRPKAHDRMADLEPFRVGAKAKGTGRPNNLAPSIGDALRRDPVQMDSKQFGKMKRGKLVPEGRIDLHGMTMDKAHPALIGFIQHAHGQGKRLVLVITGKGKHRDDGGPIPVRYGVLKHNVPQWLKMAPLNLIVMQVQEAHISHGGSGAYYVYLRKSR